MKRIEKKFEQFNNYYSDWDYRKNIDMTEPHIQSINIKKDTIEIYCEKFSTEMDDYISCDGGTLQDKTLVKRFKKLDLSKYEKVLDFMSAIDSKINWDKVTNDLDSEEEKNNISIEKNEVELDTPTTLDISKNESKVLNEKNEEYDEFEWDKEKIFPTKFLGKGWSWHCYSDGSGHLESLDGKKYMSYDLWTNEYLEYANINDYKLFPLSYYYADGIDPKEFEPFDWMEHEMLEILQREKEQKQLLNKNVKDSKIKQKRTLDKDAR